MPVEQRSTFTKFPWGSAVIFRPSGSNRSSKEFPAIWRFCKCSFVIFEHLLAVCFYICIYWRNFHQTLFYHVPADICFCDHNTHWILISHYLLSMTHFHVGIDYILSILRVNWLTNTNRHLVVELHPYCFVELVRRNSLGLGCGLSNLLCFYYARWKTFYFYQVSVGFRGDLSVIG